MRTAYATPEEIDRITARLNLSNRAALLVSLETGCRIGDVLRLRVDDLRPAPERILVLERKTGKTRSVQVSVNLYRLILRQFRAGSPWAFPGRNPARPRTRQAVWAAVKRAARAEGIRKNFGPHSMRKSYAVALMRGGAKLEDVQQILRHDNISTTVLYALADKL